MAPKKVSPEMIAQVRNEVLRMYEEHKDRYEEADIQRIKTDDLLIQRYLTREDLNVEEAIETLSGAYRWSKRNGLSKIQESEFSPELLSLVQYQGKDKNGHRCVYIRYKTAKKIVKRNAKDQEKLKRLAMYWFKKIEDETKGRNTIIVDARSVAIRDLVKYANKDLAEVAAYLGQNMVKFSPDQVGTLVFYEVPRFFAAIAERLVKLIPDTHAGQIKLLRKKDIEKIVSKDEMPDYMGGKLAASSKGSADDEADSGDEGELTNLDEIEKALEDEENTKV